MIGSNYSIPKCLWSRFPKNLITGLLIAILALFTSITSNAQQLTGSLSGMIFDQAGAVVPKAKVILKNEASGDTRSTFSDNGGSFNFAAIQPASYTLTITAEGFSPWQTSGVAISQGDSRSVANIKLTVGSATTSVTVTSGADAIVPVDTGEIATTLNSAMVSNIVLGGRDAGELLKLMPGMVATNGLNQGSSFNTKVVGTNNGPVGSYSSNGTQPNGTMAFMLDGANLVDPGNAGTQIANINQDMTAEVKVLMSGYGAEYAKGPVIFQAFSKSGGSQYHGEGYMYARNSTLNSVDAYQKSQGLSNKDEHYYYTGGNVGGPILIPFTNFNKDRKKLFFWVGYEYMSQHSAAAAINYNVPTLAQKAGDFSNPGVPQEVKNTWGYAYADAGNNLPAGVVKNVIPKSAWDPNTASILNLYPNPTITPSATNGWNNYQFINSSPQNRWEATGKIDYAIGENTKLTGSYTRQIEKDDHPIAIWWAAPWTLPYPGGVSSATTSQEYMLNFVHVFNPTTTNEFVFTYANYINPAALKNAKAADRKALGFNVDGLFGHTSSQIPNITPPWGGAFPNIGMQSFDGAFNGGGFFGGQKKDPAFYDNVSKIISVHNLKAGFYWDTNENIQSNGGADNGNYNMGWGPHSTGNVVADFLLGRPSQYQQASKIPVDDIKNHQWSVYAQDSWKASPQLTVNYGLRFDHVGQWYGPATGMQVWDPASYDNSPNAAPNTGLKWHAIDSSIPLSGFKSPLFYYEPRVGMAYDLFGNGKTVVRGGYAIFRYQFAVNSVGNSADGPQGAFTYGTSGNNINGQTLDQTGWAGNVLFTPPSSVSQNGSSIGGAMQKNDNRTPLTTDWNFAVSQQLPWRSVFEVAYVANKSVNGLLNGSNGNILNQNNKPAGSFYLPDPLTGKLVSPNAPACGGSNPSLYCQNNDALYHQTFTANDWNPHHNYQNIYVISHGSYANYNSLQMSWTKQSGPVNFLLNYTFGKVLGTRDGQSDNGASSGTMVDPFVLKNNYGPLAYDHTQSFNAGYVWNMPSFTKNAFLALAINGWQLSGTTAFASGAPIQPSTGGALNATYPGNLPVPTVSSPTTPDQSILMPNGVRSVAVNTSTWFGSNAYNVLVPLVTCDPKAHLKSGYYFNPNCFTTPAFGHQGTLVWPYLRGPAYFNSDLGIFKNFRITENQKVQFRLSATNFLNHPLPQFGLAGNGDETLNFTIPSGQPNANGLSATNTNTTTTGKPAFKTGSRSVTLAVKYFF
jgi:Carboxypeptidase regulatory-like domain